LTTETAASPTISSLLPPGGHMAGRYRAGRGFFALLLGGVVAAVSGCAPAEGAGGVVIDPDDIGGVVTGPSGPEAGVWVIAHTNALPPPFPRIVVTDDEGRYTIPDLPDAEYEVWVRGYGLTDSPRTPARPGAMLDLQSVPAASERE